ncbi:MAG: sodium:calcium antiporter, partial [Rhizobacter sp.]|nr:sodium:calcium antiporter [Rhizobacter sp.]
QSRAETAAAHAGFASEIRPAAHRNWDASMPVQLLLIAAGLACLVLGSDWLVRASTILARSLGISDLVIGLTIVAAGTSMPEVATSVAAALKGERDIAVGNVVGSCTFNLLGCLGLSSLVAGAAGLPIPDAMLNFDLWFMIAVAAACLPVFVTGREIARWEGGMFMLYYAAYVVYLILAARQRDALVPYSAAMIGFVAPLTIVTLIVMLLRRQRPDGGTA